MCKVTYDLSGIIFKIDGDIVRTDVKNEGIEYGLSSLDDYLEQNGLTGSHIISELSSFNGDIYAYDEYGN